MVITRRKKNGKEVGSYFLEYMQDGKRVRIRLDTKSLQVAKQKLREAENDLAAGDDIRKVTKTSVADVIEKFLALAESQDAKSKNANLTKSISALRTIFGPISPTLKPKRPAREITDEQESRESDAEVPVISVLHLEELRPHHIETFLAGYKKARGVKGKTLNNFREILHRMCAWAQKSELVRFKNEKNPVTNVTRWKKHEESITYLSRTQITEQLASLEGKIFLHTIVALLIYAGLRRAEVFWLTLDDLDLDKGRYGRISIRQKVVNGEEWFPKNRKNRVVPISSELRPYLDRYLSAVAPCGPWLFPTPSGCRWHEDNFSSELANANKEAEAKAQAEQRDISLPWSALDFRHTFGTHLATRGESLYKISRLMGNSPDVCQKYYADIAEGGLDGAVEFDPSKAVTIYSPDMMPTSHGSAVQQVPEVLSSGMPDHQQRPPLRLVHSRP